MFGRKRRRDTTTAAQDVADVTDLQIPVEPSIEPAWYPTADGAYMRWHDGEVWTNKVYSVDDENIQALAAA